MTFAKLQELSIFLIKVKEAPIRASGEGSHFLKFTSQPIIRLQLSQHVLSE